MGWLVWASEVPQLVFCLEGIPLAGAVASREGEGNNEASVEVVLGVGFSKKGTWT